MLGLLSGPLWDLGFAQQVGVGGMRVGVGVGVGVCQPVTVCLERVGFTLLNLKTWPLHLS